MSNEIQHHGILGMKWGRKNGPPYPLSPSDHSASEKKAGWKSSLKIGKTYAKPDSNDVSKKMTDEELASEVRRMNLEKSYSKLSKEKQGKTELQKSKEAVDETKNAVNRLKDMNREAINKDNKKVERLDLSNMTDQELRERINRENLEIQYNNMFNKPTVSAGRQKVDDLLDKAGSVLAVGSSALAIAVAIQTLKRG